MKHGVWYLRWWGFSINEGGTLCNLHMQWMTEWFWFFVYVYALGYRVSWAVKRAPKTIGETSKHGNYWSDIT